MTNYDVKTKGQVFTPDGIVERMLNMRRNHGAILEPSCGDGAFWERIKKEQDSVAIELDPDWCPSGAINMDFFDFSMKNKFDTIIGNPPYVRFSDISESTKEKIEKEFAGRLEHKKTNLYIFFIDRCIDLLNDGGELIFITPREFLKSTCAEPLNEKMLAKGSITHFFDMGDKRIFKGAAPSVAIWRFEKGCYNKSVETNNGAKTIVINRGQISFINFKNPSHLGEYFDIKVGGVSGLDKIFAHQNGNEDYVCSYTKKTGETKKYYHNFVDDYILENKEILLARRIKKFNEKNWWKWGREHCDSDRQRIYVNCKTRDTQPFFSNECKNYDGSVLALFFREETSEESLAEAVKVLNNMDWESMGFKVGGRLMFSQRALENSLIPEKKLKFLQTMSTQKAKQIKL